MNLPLCSLCQQKQANQKNSHIIPRFLKRNYQNKNKKPFVIFNHAELKKRYEQDLPKEDHLFCEECEKRFQALEGQISVHLLKSYYYSHIYHNPIYFLNDIEYQVLGKCDPKLFSLFVYSIVWRAHISKHKIFSGFELPRDCAEDLRRALLTYTSVRASELKAAIQDFKCQSWNYVFVKPKSRKNVFYSINFNDDIKDSGIVYMFLVEYALLFIIKDESFIDSKLFCILNQDFGRVRILLLNEKTWNNCSLIAAKSILANISLGKRNCDTIPNETKRK